MLAALLLAAATATGCADVVPAREKFATTAFDDANAGEDAAPDVAETVGDTEQDVTADASEVTDAAESKDAATCDDGFDCTIGDTCAAGICLGENKTCACVEDADCQDDGDLCNGVPYPAGQVLRARRRRQPMYADRPV